jgi:hypothetical protein
MISHIYHRLPQMHMKWRRISSVVGMYKKVITNLSGHNDNNTNYYYFLSDIPIVSHVRTCELCDLGWSQLQIRLLLSIVVSGGGGMCGDLNLSVDSCLVKYLI